MQDLTPPHIHAPVKVTLAMLRWHNQAIEILIVPDRALPGEVPTQFEALEHTAERVMSNLVGEPAQYIEQLYTFSRPESSGRRVVVSYLAILPAGATALSGAEWRKPEQLHLIEDLDHMVVEYSLVRLRAKLGYTSIARYLVPSRFTLSELQLVYETILEQTLDKRNFRRRMLSSSLLAETGEKRREGSHRPAALYSFAEREVNNAFLTPSPSTSETKE